MSAWVGRHLVHTRDGNRFAKRCSNITALFRCSSLNQSWTHVSYSHSSNCPIRFAGDAVPQFEPYQTEKLVRVRSKVYGGIKANWKLLMENFMEYYHLEPVHPQLCAVSGVDEHVRMQVRDDGS